MSNVINPIEKKEKYLNKIGILKQYILGSYINLGVFCKENGYSGIRYIFDYIKEKNLKIYDVYIEYNKKSYIYNDYDLAKLTATLIDWLENGIEVNGQKREIDISDYFMATNIDIGVLDLYINNIKTLTIEQYRLINKYKKRIIGLNDKCKPEEFVRSTMDTIIRNGQGEIKVTNEEKRKIFEFIYNNQLPVYVFSDVMNKYLRGEIFLDKIYSKTIPNNFKTIEAIENCKFISKIDELLATDEYLEKLNKDIDERKLILSKGNN